VRRQGLEP